MLLWRLCVLLILWLPAPAAGQEPAREKADQSPPEPKAASPSAKAGAAPAKPRARQEDPVCLMIEAAARANGLPVAYFARLIWQESSFRPGAIGPVTRSGAQAQGIAQFMPGTAAERGLLDPFDPVQALPKSAEFLSELRREFGNLGLAAAAYNAGPRRVREWISGTGFMPSETRSYVYAITGASVEHWRDHGSDGDFKDTTKRNCQELLALAKRSPGTFVGALEQRVRTVSALPWGVQLSASFNRSQALSSYARLAKSYASLLGERDPTVLRATLRSRGTRGLYQVRVGTQTRIEAERLCNRIRGAGGACMVLRNLGREG